MIAAVGALEHQQSAEQGAHQDRDIGAGLDQPGAAKHFVLGEVLRQDGIFDRPEEGRVDAHRGQCGEQQRDVVEDQPGRAEQHDPDFGAFDDAHDRGLVIGVGELAGERGQEEKWRDEQAAGDRAEGRFLLGIAINAVDHQHDHGGAEQIVVEGAEELRDEQRHEAARAEQVSDVLEQEDLPPLPDEERFA